MCWLMFAICGEHWNLLYEFYCGPYRYNLSVTLLETQIAVSCFRETRNFSLPAVWDRNFESRNLFLFMCVILRS
jgi:hypothetical protein